MKLFIDTANLQDIEEALRRGFVRGITTNPSLLSKEPKTAFEGHIGRIIGLIRQYQDGVHLSVEVFSQDPVEILRQARHFRDTFRYDSLSIKVQIGWNELGVIKKLAQEGFSVNCTCCMSVNQAMMAAAAGARYVSLFWGRIRDFGVMLNENDEGFQKLPKEQKVKLREGEKRRWEALQEAMAQRQLDESDLNPHGVVRNTRDIFDKSFPDVEIIAGSMRGATDVRDAGLAGAHIVTVPPKFFSHQMIRHFKTDEVVRQFLTDFQKWMS